MAPLPRSDSGPFLPYIPVIPQGSAWGPSPPQSVPPLGHATSPHLLLLIGPDFFKPKPYLHKYPNSLVPVILLVHTSYEDGRDRVFRKSAHKIQTPGIHSKERIQLSQHGESLKCSLTKCVSLSVIRCNCNTLHLRLEGTSGLTKKEIKKEARFITLLSLFF